MDDLDPIREEINRLREQLNEVAVSTVNSEDYKLGFERVDRWKQRAAAWLSSHVNSEEGERLLNKSYGLQMGNPHGNFVRATQAYDSVLSSLLDEFETDPDYWSERISAGTTEKAESVETPRAEIGPPLVFVGHGRNPIWREVEGFLSDDLELETETFESEPRAGKHVVEVLSQLLEKSRFAVLVLTGEDFTDQGEIRARQNVVHEAGLFQGRLGFSKAILLVQEGLEEFSNIAGLQTLRFSGETINQTFYELRRVLKREGLVD